MFTKKLLFTLNSTITDPKHCNIITKATVFNKLYTVVNLYAPNNNGNPVFFYSMPVGKASGADGFPAEFIKHSWSMWAPLFFRTEI